MSDEPSELLGRRMTLRHLAAMGLLILVAGGVALRGAVGASAATSDVWPMFMHDADHSGVAADTAIGASTASTLTQTWHRVVATDGFYSSPVVAYEPHLGYAVYIANLHGLVMALHANTGRTIWQVTLPSAVYATPAVDSANNTVYIAITGGTMYALNATNGKVVCSYTLPVDTAAGETSPGHIIASPVVGDVTTSVGSGPTVFFGDKGLSEKLNAGHEWAITGVGNTAGGCRLVWSFDSFANKGTSGNKTGSWSPPNLASNAVGKQELIFGTSNPDDLVYALDAATGAELWRYQTFTGLDKDVGAGPTVSPPGVNGFRDGVAYIDAKDDSVYALDLATGALIWSFDMQADSATDANSVSTTALSGTNLVAGYGPFVYDLNAVTGVKIWRTPGPAGGIIQASPAISGATADRVALIGYIDYSATPGDDMVGFRLSDGRQVFSASIGHQIWTSAAIGDGDLFFDDKSGDVYAYAPPR